MLFSIKALGYFCFFDDDFSSDNRFSFVSSVLLLKKKELL